MEFGKYRRQIFNKYFYDTSKIIEDIDTFNDITSEYWDAQSNNLNLSGDNKPNIRKWNPDKKEYDYYCTNSKHWKLVDPNVNDIKSIQNACN